MNILKRNHLFWAFIFLVSNTTGITAAEWQLTGGAAAATPQDREELRLQAKRSERARLNQEKKDQGVKEQCPICLDEAPAKELFETPCSHFFHGECLLAAQRTSPTAVFTCPACRSRNLDFQVGLLNCCVETGLKTLTQNIVTVDEMIATKQEQLQSAQEANNEEAIVTLTENLTDLTRSRQELIETKNEIAKAPEMVTKRIKEESSASEQIIRERRRALDRETLLAMETFEESLRDREIAQERVRDQELRRTGTQLPLMRYGVYAIVLASSGPLITWLFSSIKKYTDGEE